MSSGTGASQPTRRNAFDRPSLDWVLCAVLVVVGVRFTPLIEIFTAAEEDGQRSVMSSVSALLANVAAFGVAALFAYSALSNPTTRRVRVRWGSYMSGVFLRSLGLMFVSSVVVAFSAASVPHPAATIVFFSATLLGFVKLVRLLLLVGYLLRGQDADARREDRPTPGVQG